MEGWIDGQIINIQIDKIRPKPEKQPKRQRTRTRNITWFNPPFSQNVTIGKKFLNLIDKCFPPANQLHKIINRNCVKVSYSCMPNIKQTISQHNKRKLETPEQLPTTTNNCNCRKTCPVERNCLTSSIIYQATVTRNDTPKKETYIGLTENSFKTRYTGHLNSFKHSANRNATSLSHYIWSLKDKDINYEIKWKLITQAKAYSKSTKKCNLCLTEKYFIICKPEMATLNTRNELASACRHKRKHLLRNVI